MNFQRISRSRTSVALAAMALLACSTGDTETAFAKSAPDRAVSVVPASAAPAAGVMLRFILAPTEQAARYRVRERLVGHDLPNDAVGETKSVTGAIAFDS